MNSQDLYEQSKQLVLNLEAQIADLTHKLEVKDNEVMKGLSICRNMTTVIGRQLAVLQNLYQAATEQPQPGIMEMPQALQEAKECIGQVKKMFDNVEKERQRLQVVPS